MHIETERKFLVRGDAYRHLAVKSIRMKQGYIAHDGGNTVRIRIQNDISYLTIKGRSVNGISRPEWEKSIPASEAEELLQLCHGGIIDKTRYIIPAGGNSARYFEVDEFYGENDGLVMAEIELGSEDEAFPRPDWLGEEVTGDKRYYNSYLTKHPFNTW